MVSKIEEAIKFQELELKIASCGTDCPSCQKRKDIIILAKNCLRLDELAANGKNGMVRLNDVKKLLEIEDVKG
jgi:hypothetical protein